MANWTQRTISSGKLMYNNSNNKLHFARWRRPALGLIVRNYYNAVDEDISENRQQYHQQRMRTKYKDMSYSDWKWEQRMIQKLRETSDAIPPLSNRIDRILREISNVDKIPKDNMQSILIELKDIDKQLVKLSSNIGTTSIKTAHLLEKNDYTSDEEDDY